MSEIDTAITQLDAEVAAIGFPKEDTVEWWILRAKSTGASLLRAMQQRSLTNLEADQFRRGVRIGMMKSDTPDVIEVAIAADQAALAKPVQVTP